MRRLGRKMEENNLIRKNSKIKLLKQEKVIIDSVFFQKG